MSAFSNSPSAAELVTAIRSFLEDKAMPELKGHTAFHARVAANALAILERELSDAPSAEERASARLSDLLGRQGSYEDLTRLLATRIRAGDMTPQTPGLIEHLRETTIDKVMIDQPHYSGLQTALARRGR